MEYSIIIPTLNEAETLPKLIANLSGFDTDKEIIIVDCGSCDSTDVIAQNANLILLIDLNGRGSQMNTGAENAEGEILLFVHSDTVLPQNTFEIIENTFSKSNVQIASFKMKFNNNKLILKLYSFFTRFDSLFTNFGDQVIVVRKSFFNELGGFPNQKIMEDLEFLRIARKKTKIHKLNSYVITSARRFEKLGFFKTQVLNLWYIIKYLNGTSPTKIYEQYFKSKTRFSGYNIRKISGAGKSKNAVGFRNG